jgi:hypothetical protein
MIQLTGTVKDGMIEVAAPRDLTDGSRVPLLVLGSAAPEPTDMDDAELERTLAALKAFEDAFGENEDGEDLSQAARESAGWEKAQSKERATKIESRFE